MPRKTQGSVRSLRLTAEEERFLDVHGLNMSDLWHEIMDNIMAFSEERPPEEILAEFEARQRQERANLEGILEGYFRQRMVDGVDVMKRKSTVTFIS